MVWVVALRIASLDPPAFPGASYDVVGDANEERSLLAAGKDVNVVGHRLGPTPRGPGNKCRDDRSEEHTSELQSLMRISYAVFCLKKKKLKHIRHAKHTNVQTNKVYDMIHRVN